MKRRPSLDDVERLVATHTGECPQPCDACDLAAEVVALLRVLKYVAETGEMPQHFVARAAEYLESRPPTPAERAELQAGDWRDRDKPEGRR